jgi:hypothetical protein
MPNSASDVLRRREKANAFCEAIRALDATGLLSFFFFFWEDHIYILLMSFTFTILKYIASHELQLKVDCT